jgi:hypothetical protein
MVWVVSLSTTDVGTRRLTRAACPLAFAVCPRLVSGEAPAQEQRSTSRGSDARLYLNTFRGERAISVFDWHFTPTHKSSERFVTHTGSALHVLLGTLQPAHG